MVVAVRGASRGGRARRAFGARVPLGMLADPLRPRRLWLAGGSSPFGFWSSSCCSISCAAKSNCLIYVEVVAGLGRRLGVNGGHEPAEDHEGGQAAHAAAVEVEQAETVAGHGGMDGAEAVRRLRHERAICRRRELNLPLV